MTDCLGAGAAIGGATQAGAAIYGAHEQAATAAANLKAQVDRQNLVQQYMQNYLTPQSSPYASAMMQFLSTGRAPGQAGPYSGVGPSFQQGPYQGTGPQLTGGGGGGSTASINQKPGNILQLLSGNAQGATPAATGSGAASNSGAWVAGSPYQAPGSTTDSNYNSATGSDTTSGHLTQQDLLSLSAKDQKDKYGFSLSQDKKDWKLAGTADAQGNVMAADGSGRNLGNAPPGQVVYQDSTTGQYQALQTLNAQKWWQTGTPGDGSAWLQAAPNSGPGVGQGTTASGVPNAQTALGSGQTSNVAPPIQTLTPSGQGNGNPNGGTEITDTGGSDGTDVSGIGTQNLGSLFGNGQAPASGSYAPPGQQTGVGQLPSMYNYQAQNPFTYSASLYGQGAPQGGPSDAGGGGYTGPQLTGNGAGQFGPGNPNLPNGGANNGPFVAASMGTQGFNAGQDSGMQSLGVSPGAPNAPNNPQLTPATFDPGTGGGGGGSGDGGGASSGGGNALNSIMPSGLQQYDNSGLFGALQNASDLDLMQKMGGVMGTAGSLGRRFGTAMNQNLGLMAANAVTGLNTTRQQIGSQSFEQAQGRQLQAGLANQSALNQAGQFNASAGQTMSSQNAQQGNIFNQLMMGGASQAANTQQGATGANTSLLGLLAGLGVPQAQSSPYPGAVNSIGQIATLYPFLQQLYNSGQTAKPAAASTGNGYDPSRV